MAAQDLPLPAGVLRARPRQGQMAALGGFASKMGLASGPAVAALIVGDDNYGLLINVSVIALVACLLVMILPARVLDKR